MQNDFVIRAKKAVKKVAALAGSAIIASSLVTPAMSATLADLPAPFISSGLFDANVIVGSQTWNALVSGDPAGVASDLAGAIDVAAAFAQQATAAAGASGTVTLNIPQTPGMLKNSTAGYLPIGGAVDSGNPSANTFNKSLTGFDWMQNSTRVYNSTDYLIWEILTVDSGNLDSTATFRSYGGVKYNITTNGTAVPVNFDSWPMFGSDYQLISGGSTQLRFGQLSTENNIAFGTEVAVGDKATVVVSDWDTASSKAKVTITGADGHIWIDDYYAEGKVFDNTTNGYTITLSDVVISSILGNSVDIEWSSSSLTLSNQSGQNNASSLVGESSPFSNWTVLFDYRTEGLYSVQFTSPVLQQNGMVMLNPGEMIDGEYFNISFDGWNTNNYTAITLSALDGSSDGADLIYTNNATSPVAKNINLDSVSDVWQSIAQGGALNANKSNSVRLLTSSDVFQFQFRNASQPQNISATQNMTENAIAVWSGSTNIWNLTAYTIGGESASGLGGLGCVACGAKSWGYATFNTSGAWYNISFDNSTFNISLLNWSSNSGNSYTGDNELGGQYFTDNLAWSIADVHEWNSNATTSGTLTLTEPNSATLAMSITRGAIGSVSSSDSGTGTVTSTNTEYTYHGTEVAVSATSIVLSYPESRRTADLWIGRSTTESTAFNVGDTITGTTYTVASVGAGGSPAINEVTPGIGTVDTSVVFTSLSKPAILVGGSSVNKGVYELGEDGVAMEDFAADTAYFQLVENAFGGSETVLVIAGYEAKDTKMACQAMAAQIAGHMDLGLTGNLVWLDTSGSTYSTITVI